MAATALLHNSDEGEGERRLWKQEGPDLRAGFSVVTTSAGLAYVQLGPATLDHMTHAPRWLELTEMLQQD